MKIFGLIKAAVVVTLLLLLYGVFTDPSGTAEAVTGGAGALGSAATSITSFLQVLGEATQ